MKAEVVSSASEVTFRLVDVEPEFESAIRSAFWQATDAGWQKTYPENASGIDQVALTFAANAEAMFRQMAGLDQNPWEAALEAFAERAAAAGVDWWLTGSAATAIRVAGIVPHDVDIMFAPEHLVQVRETFADVLIEPVLETGGWVTRFFGVAFLHGRIDLASDPIPEVDVPEPADFGQFAAANLETVAWRGYALQVPPLAVQAAVNRRRGRSERGDQIEAVLGAHSAGSFK